MLRYQEKLSPAMVIREVRAVYTTAIADPDGRGQAADAKTVAGLLIALFETDTEPQENLLAVYLDGKHRIIATERIYRGTVNATTVSSRDIVRNALLQNAVAVIVAHNHPSGDPTPSADDIAFTRRLATAAARGTKRIHPGGGNRRSICAGRVASGTARTAAPAGRSSPPNRTITCAAAGVSLAGGGGHRERTETGQHGPA